MKTALLFSIAAVVCLGTVGADEPERVSVSEPSYWEGRPADEILAAWGEPTKTKRYGRGGNVLVYRLRFFGDQTVGGRPFLWSDVGIGPSPLGPEGPKDEAEDHHALVSVGAPRISGGQEIIATQKIKFYVNDEGEVFREKFGRLKWKKKQ